MRGVDPHMFRLSLDIAARAWKARHTTKGPGPVARIIGPNFSGSPSSIARVVQPWLAARFPRDGERDKDDLRPTVAENTPVLSWINGQALTLDTRWFAETFQHPWKDAVNFRSVVHGSKDLNDVLFTYVSEHCKPILSNNKVAYLTEETTGFGRAVAQTQQTSQLAPQPNQQQTSAETPHQNSQQRPEVEKDKAFEVYIYSFPAHVSEIRRRYARQTTAASQQSVTLKSAEQLAFTHDEGADTPDMISFESPGVMAANDEMRLLRIAQDIKSPRASVLPG